MNNSLARMSLALAFGLPLAEPVVADDTIPPPTTAAPTQPTAPAPAPRSTEGVRVAPVDQNPGESRSGAGLLLAEGTFIANRKGWMDRLSTGDWKFTFEEEPGADPIAPMILQPCQRLAEIVRIVEARPERVLLTISGRVYVYAGQNFLLPTVFATATQQSEAPADSSKKPAETGADIANPSLQDLVAEVDQATRPSDNPRPASTPSTVNEGAPRLRREGTAIVSQTGRLSRGGRNWVFTIDNDVDTRPGAPGAEEVAPLEVLPCLNLSEMERLFERHGNALRFTISGIVYTFKERNMLLPTMYVIDVDRDGNLTSAQ